MKYISLNDNQIFSRSFLNRKNVYVLVLIVILTIFVAYFYLNDLTLQSNLSFFLGNLKFITYTRQLNDSRFVNDNNSLPEIKSATGDAACDIINRSYVPYYADIDGVRYPKHSVLFLNRSINFQCLNANKIIKRILFWNPFFGDWSYSFGLGAITPFKNQYCPVYNCELTSDKKLINESDYVVVHMRDGVDQPPAYRPSFQRWIFSLYESPVHSGDFTKYNGFFNLTSTYTLDSHFPGFYEAWSKFYWKRNDDFDDKRDFLANKTKFAAAVISNCGASSKRLDYIGEMGKFVNVDVFGKCGKPCPDKFSNSTPGDCKDIIGQEYKFYLAFENSYCKDYITEKFFISLKNNIIPIVLGGGRYDEFIPKSGYINIKDYASPKHLADYLTYLTTNSTAYNSYFKWKKHVTFIDNIPSFPPICDMCIKLQLESHIGIEQNIIHDIGTYWSKKENCFSPSVKNVQYFEFEKS